MKYNVTEIPDNWVVLKIPDGFKVFATWAGGYLDGDSWKLNSGIKEVEEDEDYYYFIGFSGSCYKCHKKGYGVATSYGQSVLDKILDTKKVEVMDEETDWMSLELHQ